MTEQKKTIECITSTKDGQLDMYYTPTNSLIIKSHTKTDFVEIHPSQMHSVMRILIAHLELIPTQEPTQNATNIQS